MHARAPVILGASLFLLGVPAIGTIKVGDVATVARGITRAEQGRARAGGSLEIPGVGDFAHNDLWAIHDLLLAGYSALFLKKESPARVELQNKSLALAELLPSLHPYGPCRASIASALEAGGAALERLVSAARASWECLPGRFSEASFDHPFTPDMIGDSLAASEARMTIPKNKALFAVCQGSQWPRTCSYWVALHTMALRADWLGKSREFLGAVVPLLAGGATLCGGCTRHMRLLHEPVLSPLVSSDYGSDF